MALKSLQDIQDALDLQVLRSKTNSLVAVLTEVQDKFSTSGHTHIGADQGPRLAWAGLNDEVGIQSAVVTIPFASVRTLNATPVDIIAAPAAGYAIVPIFAQFFLDFGTAGYDSVGSSDDLVLRYTNASGNVIMTVESTGFLNATADATAFGFPPASFVATSAAKVVAHILTGEIYSAAGDSPLLVRVWYRVLPVALT